MHIKTSPGKIVLVQYCVMRFMFYPTFNQTIFQLSNSVYLIQNLNNKCLFNMVWQVTVFAIFHLAAQSMCELANHKTKLLRNCKVIWWPNFRCGNVTNNIVTTGNFPECFATSNCDAVAKSWINSCVLVISWLFLFCIYLSMGRYSV